MKSIKCNNCDAEYQIENISRNKKIRCGVCKHEWVYQEKRNHHCSSVKECFLNALSYFTCVVLSIIALSMYSTVSGNDIFGYIYNAAYIDPTLGIVVNDIYEPNDEMTVISAKIQSKKLLPRFIFVKVRYSDKNGSNFVYQKCNITKGVIKVKIKRSVRNINPRIEIKYVNILSL